MSPLIIKARLGALKLMDLDHFRNDDDTNKKVIALCRSGKPRSGIRRRFVFTRVLSLPIARKTLKEQASTPDIRIATVTNFPHGNDDIDIETGGNPHDRLRCRIADVVFPYRALIAGNQQVGFDLGKACKDACAAANGC